ncbi:hypothetical protein CPB86DRAFT_869977 [Serendipita vermifera]|nr:hypothetical protein CPB86DRAFT_869977 [Serendipita vermifera]
MPPDTTENNINHSAKLFGLRREPKRPGDPLVVTGETTAWEIYNHKASEVDREMIKDWNDSLNTLLIFTALYSGVLTAFIIESMKLLEEDPVETTRDILLIMSRQLANSSFPAFEPTAYETPQYAIVVNGLFFTSLSCALIAALLAVLALQWVANYDMGLNTSSPEKRAFQRHIRFRGIEKWKMSELIASLPLLIFAALFLFFIGIADWLWHMNRAISGIVIGGIGIGCLLYTVTNLISIVNVEAPFRTPISKELAVLIPRIVGWLQAAIIKLSSTDHAYDIPEEGASHMTQQRLAFTKCEEKMFDTKGKGAIALDGLLWLANHVEISSASRDTFLALVKALTEVPATSLMDEEKIKNAPWMVIFEMLCSPCIEKKEYEADELERAMWICKGMGIIPYLESRMFERFFEDLRNSSDRHISGMAYFAGYKQKDRGLPPWQSSVAQRIGTAFEHTNEAISQIGYNYLHFMLLSIKKEWPEMTRLERAELAESMADAWTVPSAAIRDESPSVVLPTHSIELILDLVIPGDGVDTIYARFLAAVQPSGNPYEDGDWNNALCLVLRMITRQLILQISQHFDSLSDLTKELKMFASFMDAKRLNLAEEGDVFMWVMLNKFTRGNHRERDKISDTLCRGLYSRPFELACVDLILALDNFVTRLSPPVHFYSKVACFIDILDKIRSDLDRSANLNLLGHLQDPCLAWIASWLHPKYVQFQPLSHPDFGEWDATIEQGFVRVLDPNSSTTSRILNSDARITFLRALILDGPSNARIGALDCFYWYRRVPFADEKWHRLFASPILGVILERSVKSEEFPILSILSNMTEFPWFDDEFSQANGLDWLPLIALNAIHPRDRRLLNNVLAEILVDHILSSRANRDIRAPLSSSYHYLQSIGQRRNPQDHDGLANLRTALLWVLDESTEAHDSHERTNESSPLVFDPPILERVGWPRLKNVRSFEFIKDMSDEEWEDWVTRLKVMIMGVSQGGLKPGPFQNRNRFCRDPDGVCGRM